MATTNPSQDARCKKEVTSAAPGLVCVCVWQFFKELNGLRNSRGKSNKSIIFLINFNYFICIYIFI
jgi:hypothetical protein